MPVMTEPNSVGYRPTPHAEKPLPPVDPSLARIVEQLDTIIQLLRKPERDEKDREQEERQAAKTNEEALRNYTARDTEEFY